jgi:hypothetical protein
MVDPSELIHERSDNYRANLAHEDRQAVGNGPGGILTAADVGLTQQAVDQAARQMLAGKEPTLPRGKDSGPAWKVIRNRAAELNPNADLAANAAGYRADANSQSKLQGSRTPPLVAFDTTASQERDDPARHHASVSLTWGTRFANKLRPRRLAGQMGRHRRSPTSRRCVRRSLNAEYARIISNPNLSTAS